MVSSSDEHYKTGFCQVPNMLIVRRWMHFGRHIMVEDARGRFFMCTQDDTGPMRPVCFAPHLLTDTRH